MLGLPSGRKLSEKRKGISGHCLGLPGTFAEEAHQETAHDRWQAILNFVLETHLL